MPFYKPTGLKHVRATITFDGTAGLGEASTAVPVFTIAGRVLVERITAYCTVDLTEAMATATVALGTATDVDKFIAVTNSTAIDAGEWWATATPTAGAASITTPAVTDPTTAGVQGQPTAIDEDIIITPATQDTDAGTLVIDCWYEPITAGASLS